MCCDDYPHHATSLSYDELLSTPNFLNAVRLRDFEANAGRSGPADVLDPLMRIVSRLLVYALDLVSSHSHVPSKRKKPDLTFQLAPNVMLLLLTSAFGPQPGWVARANQGRQPQTGGPPRFVGCY
jgi:hypothetical protein